jgi:acyl-CoA synthetase (AMP-forming)/AMP-acid ligase II
VPFRKNTALTMLSADDIERYYASGHWSDETIYLAARAQAERNPDAFAVRDAANRLTYGQLIACADALAARMHAAGVQPGQRVGLWTASRVETAIVWLACSRNGYTCCPSLHRDHTVGDVNTLMRRVRIAAFIGQQGWGADATRHHIFKELADLASIKFVIDLAEQDSAHDLLAPSRRVTDSVTVDVSAVPVCRDPNRVVYLAFTSGTTGEPKGVMHSDNTLLSNARAIAKDWNFGASSVLYTMSPLSHNLGLGAMISAFATGAELTVHDLARGASLVDRLIETNTTFLFGVPTHGIDILNELRQRGLKTLGRLEGFRISGAAAPADLVAGLIEHGVKPQSGYGMTEACSHHYTLPQDDAEHIIGTSGRACSGYEVRIWSTDDHNTPVPAGVVGQIGGRGASLMLGYFDNQQATEESFNASGWFMTGDLGKMTEDGYLIITGRKKDLIIRGGHNIYPAKIENLAMRHPAVARAAALPVPDARMGEKVCLAVMLKPGQSIEAEALLAHMDDAGLSRYDMPEFYIELEEIPLTASGKIFKRGLVDEVREGRLPIKAVRFKAADAVSA